MGIHNTISQLFASQSGIKARLRHVLFPYLINLADGIIAVSQGVAEDLAQMTGVRVDRIQVIYNPLPLHAIRAKSREAVTHGFFQLGGPPVIIGIGHLEERKGFDTLIHAFARLLSRMPLRLLILGEGSQRHALEELVHSLDLDEKVSLPGFVSNPYGYLSRSSVFVLSSRFEGLGMVLIEALALGVPVVATNCPSGPAEILEHGRYGQLVPVANAEALAAGILRALQSRPNLDESCHLLRKFLVDGVVDRYLDTIRNAVNIA